MLAFTWVLSVISNMPQSYAGTFPGENGRIAFVSYRDSNYDIYVMNSDGSGQTRLTTNPFADLDPSWSPDGKQIAYSTGFVGGGGIAIMNADGTDKIILPVNGNWPSWSPDGSKIAYSKSPEDGNLNIYVVNVDGTGETKLTDTTDIDALPEWSPDGNKIMFVRTVPFSPNNEIYVMNADGTGQTNVSNSPSTWDSTPVWSPDGTKIAFSQDGIISIMDADGHNIVNLPAAGDSPSWSPDGSKIVFPTRDNGHLQIYSMNIDGTGQINLSNNLHQDFYPDYGTFSEGRNVLLAEKGIISIGDTVTIIQELDTTSGLDGSLISLTVLEADGDTCYARDLPAMIDPSGLVIKEYPGDFSIAISVGDGVCDTMDVGIYAIESQVSIGMNELLTNRAEFETNFFVIPESPIGALPVVLSSLAALAAFAYLRKRS